MRLLPDERVALEARRHGVVLARPLARALVLAGAGAVLVFVGWPFTLAGALFLGLGAALGLLAVWRWERTVLVLTTDKLVVRDGTLRRRIATVRLAGLGALEVDQTLLGRLLGYGTVTAGELEVDYVPEIRRVAELLERFSARPRPS